MSESTKEPESCQGAIVSRLDGLERASFERLLLDKSLMVLSTSFL